MRHIVRATAYYQCLLEDSKHPDFLRDALDRDRFSLAWRSPPTAPSRGNSWCQRRYATWVQVKGKTK